MKNIIFVLISILLFSCANNPNNNSENKTTNTNLDQTEPPDRSNLTTIEKIITLLPQSEYKSKLFNENIDLLNTAKQSNNKEDDNNILEDDFASISIYDDEYYETVNIKTFDKKDGSKLVIFTKNEGYNSEKQTNKKAYIYKNNELKVTLWPLQQPNFQEFTDAIASYGISNEDLKKIKSQWSTIYSTAKEVDDNNKTHQYIKAFLYCTNYPDFSHDTRTIQYEWNGERFTKSYLPLPIVDKNRFGGIKLGDILPKKIDDFTINDSNKGTLEIKKDKQLIATIYYSNAKINSIYVYSSDYSLDNGIKIGNTVESVLQECTEHKLYNIDNKAILQTYYGFVGCNEEDFECEPEGELGYCSIFQNNPNAIVKSLIATNIIPTL